MFQEFATLTNVAMDFTLEDWEDLGLDHGDVFWDTALDNYQNLFLLSESLSQLCDNSSSPTEGTLGSPASQYQPDPCQLCSVD